MIIQKFYRNITEDPHWVLHVKAKWGEKTNVYIVSFDSFTHPDLIQETYLCVRIWESQKPNCPVEKHSFIREIEEVKKRLGVNSVIDLYQKYKEGVNCDN